MSGLVQCVPTRRRKLGVARFAGGWTIQGVEMERVVITLLAFFNPPIVDAGLTDAGLVVRRHITRCVGKTPQAMKEEIGYYTIQGESSLLNG